jgi:hypothetical protein
MRPSAQGRAVRLGGCWSGWDGRNGDHAHSPRTHLRSRTHGHWIVAIAPARLVVAARETQPITGTGEVVLTSFRGSGHLNIPHVHVSLGRSVARNECRHPMG